MSKKIEVLPGQRFGRLTIVREIEPNRHGHRQFECICDCESTTDVSLMRLRSQKTKSCGCYRNKLTGERATMNNATHGHTRGGRPSDDWAIWHAMKERCLNPKVSQYFRYGGRGITICPEWIASFDTFLKDVGPRPSPLHSLDRIDNSQGYYPGNIRWATATQQMRNMRGNRLLTIDGTTKCTTEWAEQVGIKRNTITERLRAGWSVEKAVFTPVATRGQRNR